MAPGVPFCLPSRFQKMARATPNYEDSREFWKPATPRESGTTSGTLRPYCPSCGAQFVTDSLYCHVCGMDRQAADDTERGFRVPAQVGLASRAVSRLVSHSIARLGSRLALLRDVLGQTNASLASLLAGGFCLLAALFTGLFFNATTLLDWQAVQVWRIEWLLAAIALMIAAVLLKKQTK
jgi:uncharacterized protein (DUF983 family)